MILNQIQQIIDSYFGHPNTIDNRQKICYECNQIFFVKELNAIFEDSTTALEVEQGRISFLVNCDNELLLQI